MTADHRSIAFVLIGGEESPRAPQEAHLGDKTAKPVFSSRFVAVIRAVVAAAAVVTVAGCVTAETRVRVVSRAGALRDVATQPTVPSVPMRVAAGSDVLNDAELAALEAALPQKLQGVLPTTSSSSPSSSSATVVDAVSITIKAAPGREHHKRIASCRLRLKAGTDVVADVEATTQQRVQARNVSAVELAGIVEAQRKAGGRHPLLAVEHSELAIVEACSAALRALVDDGRPDDATIDRANGAGAAAAERRATRQHRRDVAIDKLEAELLRSPRRHDAVAAALVDIGELGTVADAKPVGRFIYDDNALVRRAAQSAFSSLCAGHAALGVDAALCTPPTAPAASVVAAPPVSPSEATPTAADLARRPEPDDDAASAGPPAPLAPMDSIEAPTPQDGH
jgi:hypothetical protein